MHKAKGYLTIAGGIAALVGSLLTTTSELRAQAPQTGERSGSRSLQTSVTTKASTTTNYKGSVTQLNPGTGIILTPNPITTTGTISIDGSVVPQSSGSNTFTGNQTIVGNLTVGSSAPVAPTLAGSSTSGNVTITGDLTLGGSINQGLVIQVTSSTPNVIGGFNQNSVASGVTGATISGGGDATVGINQVTGADGTVGGGVFNKAGNGSSATVGGGYGNVASGNYATVSGGTANQATFGAATVGGGAGNIASGVESTIPGGVNNKAEGNLSFAGGACADAVNAGSFVWAGSSQAGSNGCNGTFKDSAANQFAALVPGGVAFYTSSDSSTGVSVSSGSGSWSSVSDRNVKEHFAPVEGNALLQKLDAIPIETWSYKSQNPSIRHMGPMAQDFRVAFGLGEDEKHIGAVDAEGVALAGIQALYRLLSHKDEQIQQQQAEIQKEQGELRELQMQLQELQSAVKEAAEQLRTLRSRDHETVAFSPAQ